MGLLSKYKKVTIEKKSVSKSRSFEEIVDDTIQLQIDVNIGIPKYGTKRNKKTGEYNPIQSWWDKGVVRPKIWIKPLTGNSEDGFEMTKDEFGQFLESMKGWRDDDELRPLIDAIEKQYTEQMAKMQQKRNSK